MIPQIKDQIQLAKEIPLDKLNYPCWGEVKYDGARVLAFITRAVDPRERTCELYTRAGLRIKSRALEAELIYATHAEWAGALVSPPETIPEDQVNVVLDGELCCNLGKMAGRTIINGLIGSAVKGGEIDIITNVCFYTLDGMSRAEFDAKHCTKDYFQRMEYLVGIVACTDYVDWAGRMIVNNPLEATAMFDELVSQGYEGIVLKPREHKYSFTRSKDWAKKKCVKTADIKVVGWDKGKGKNSERVGALVCGGTVEGVDVFVKVSGMTDAMREKKDWWLGKTIEVKYLSVTVDKKTGKHSLFQPRFICVREDK